MPMMMGFAKKQKQLIENLAAVFRTVRGVFKPTNLATHPINPTTQHNTTHPINLLHQHTCLIHPTFSHGHILQVMKKYNLAPGDFPDIRDFQDKLTELDFSKFHGLKQKLIDDVETVLANDIPRLMGALPRCVQHTYIHTYSLTHLSVSPSSNNNALV